MSQWYDALPPYAQNLICDLYGAKTRRERYGPRFESRLDSLLKSEWWSQSEIDAFRDESVRRMVEHAYKNVPFYAHRMRDLKLSPDDINGVSDLPLLPVTTKDDIRSNHDQFIARNVRPGVLMGVHTSGTTGSSLHLKVNRDAIPFRWAVWWRHRMRFGVLPDEWHVNFTGKAVVPENVSKPPFWRRSRPLHQYLVNMQQLTPARIRSLAADLDATGARFFTGYPSIIHIYCRLLLEAGIELKNPPKFVFTGAENVLAHQRRDIEAVTGATLSDQYGFTEGAGNASHCERFVYHEDFEYGVLECVDSERFGDNQTRGRIVATGFASPGFPLLRYDVGDWAVWPRETFRCSCGRNSRVLLSIDGRSDDYVITPEGRRIMRFDYLFKDTPSIREAQVVQENVGGIVVRVVLEDQMTDELEVVRKLVREWISPRLAVRFEIVPNLPRGENGKLKAVVSSLPREIREGRSHA